MATHITLIEFAFSTGTKYYSFDGVRAPSQYYEDLVLTVDPIVREISPFGKDFTVSNVGMRLMNRNRVFSILKDAESRAGRGFRNVAVTIKYGLESAGLAAMTTVFTGVIKEWSLSNAVLNIDVRDTSMDRFMSKVSNTMKCLTSTVFPNLPDGTEPKLVPLVYGWVGNPWASTIGGVIPCYRIDPAVSTANYFYVVSQSAAKQLIISGAYVYGVFAALSGYTSAIYDGVRMTYFTRGTDPKDANRPDELELTAYTGGATDDNTLAGNIITNPVSWLEHFLTTYAGVDSGELDSTLWNAAKAVATAQRYDQNNQARDTSNGWVLVDRDMSYADVIQQWCESYCGSFFLTSTGKFGVTLQTDSQFSASTLSVSDSTDILKGSFKVRSNKDVASKIQYNYMYNWAFGFFERQPDFTVFGQEAAIGESVRYSVNLYAVRAAPSALNVVKAYAELLKENVQFLDFSLPSTYFTQLDLNQIIDVTHWQGVSATGGYSNAKVRVLRIAGIVQPRSMHVEVMGIKRSDEYQPLDGFVQRYDGLIEEEEFAEESAVFKPVI